MFRFLSHERDLNSLSWCTSAVGSGECVYILHFEYVQLIILHFPKMGTLYFGAFHLSTELSVCRYSTVTGLESSITDPKEYDIQLKNVSVVVESRDDDKLHVSF